MDSPFTPEAESTRRLDLLRKGLAALGLEGALLLQAVDVLWLSGHAPERRPLGARRGRAGAAGAQEPGAGPGREPARPGRPVPALEGAGRRWSAPARRLGLTLDMVPVAVQQFWTKALPGAEWTDVSGLVRDSAQREVRLGARPDAGHRAPPRRRLPRDARPSCARGCARWTWPPRSRCACAAPATRAAPGCAASTRSSSWGWPSPEGPPPRRATSTGRSPAAGSRPPRRWARRSTSSAATCRCCSTTPPSGTATSPT